MTCYATCATAALANTVAQPGCALGWAALAVTNFLQVGQQAPPRPCVTWGPEQRLLRGFAAVSRGSVSCVPG